MSFDEKLLQCLLVFLPFVFLYITINNLIIQQQGTIKAAGNMGDGGGDRVCLRLWNCDGEGVWCWYAPAGQG